VFSIGPVETVLSESCLCPCPAHSHFVNLVTVSFCDLAGAQACVLVFSTTDRESFEAISSWREKVVAEVGDIPTALVQNKIDLLDDSCIKK
jgi:hypothetical protein